MGMPDVDLNTGFIKLMGLEIVEASGERVVVRWEARPDLHQPFGLVHGGVYCAAIETAASIGGVLWLDGRGTAVGVSNQTDFLHAVREGELTATAAPVHRGTLQQLWAVEITDAGGRLVARGQVRLQNLPGAPAASATAPVSPPSR